MYLYVFSYSNEHEVPSRVIIYDDIEKAISEANLIAIEKELYLDVDSGDRLLYINEIRSVYITIDTFEIEKKTEDVYIVMLWKEGKLLRVVNLFHDRTSSKNYIESKLVERYCLKKDIDKGDLLTYNGKIMVISRNYKV